MKNIVIFIKKNLYVFSLIPIILIFIFFYFLHISLSLAAAISAIIISIDGIYLSRESSILPAKLKHSEDLRNFVLSWKRQHTDFYNKTVKQLIFPNIKHSINFRNNKRVYFIKEVHSQLLYKDIITTHLKKNYKKLPQIFLEYYYFINEYNKILKKTYEIIKKFSIDYFKHDGYMPDINNYKGNDTVRLDFFDIIYLYFYKKILPRGTNNSIAEHFLKNKKDTGIDNLFSYNIYPCQQPYELDKKIISDNVWGLDLIIPNTKLTSTLAFLQKEETAKIKKRGQIYLFSYSRLRLTRLRVFTLTAILK
ncbi:MAG: hypothetical protein M1576_00525 [Deltaproteobacteria bacterium]|nr:hypothetical protein [Deltaproteobacteria bacterium]